MANDDDRTIRLYAHMQLVRLCLRATQYLGIRILALIAISGQLGQLCIDPEYYNQYAGNTVTHACSEGTPHGGTAVLHKLQGNAGKIEKSSKY
jgi:triacylglycerol esterase/lipase EstA (alpha/beta hydrolase family)